MPKSTVLVVAVLVSVLAITGCSATPASSPIQSAKPEASIVVPNVVGKSFVEAFTRMRDASLDAVPAASAGAPDVTWIVTTQTPKAGSHVPSGSPVTLSIQPPPTPTPTPIASTTPDPVSMLTYSVTGNGSRASITYTKVDGSYGTTQVTDAHLPWSLTLPITGLSPHVLVAQAKDGSSISCSLSVDGEAPIVNTSTGSYAVVSCG